MMRIPGRLHRFDRDEHRPSRPVLEAHRHRKAAGQLAMNLALGRSRANRSPRHQVRDELRRNRVEELRPGRQPHFGQGAQQAARDAQPVIDVEASVEIGIVDQSLPPDGGARLLEVGAHDDQQIFGMLITQRFEPLGVLEGCVRVVNRAGADDHQQSIILAVDDVADLFARGRDPRDRLVPGMDLLHQDGGWDQRAKALNPDVVGRRAEHESRASSTEAQAASRSARADGCCATWRRRGCVRSALSPLGHPRCGHGADLSPGLRVVSRVRADHAGAADHHARHGAHPRAFRFFPRFSRACAHPLGGPLAVHAHAAARLGCGLPVSTTHRLCRRLGVGLLLSRRNGVQRDRLLGQSRRRAFGFDDRVLDDARRCIHTASHGVDRRQPSRRRRLGPVSQHRKSGPTSGCARALHATISCRGSPRRFCRSHQRLPF